MEQTQTLHMEEQPEQAQDNLTLADVILMYNIISTVSRRGAFDATEFEVVGKLFSKLKSFIPQEQTDSETTETNNTSEEAEQFEFSFNQEQ
jgi:hypothetical protein